MVQTNLPAFIEKPDGTFVHVDTVTRSDIEWEPQHTDSRERAADLRRLLRDCGPALAGDTTVGDVLDLDGDEEGNTDA
jgi:hypothetical protein